MKEEDIKQLYGEFSTNKGSQFHYKQFLDSLENFSFDYDKVYEDMRVTYKNAGMEAQKNRYKSYIDKLRKESKQDPFNYFTTDNMPASKVEDVFENLLRIKRYLKNYFPEQEDFDQFLKGASKGESFDKSLMRRDEFKNLMQSAFDKFENKIPKRGLEKFLAFLNTNKHQKLNLSEISDLVYNENNERFFERVQKRLKGPPPVYSRKDLPDLDKDEEELRLKRLMKDPNPKESNLQKSEIQIMKIIDDEVFKGRESQFETFNRFDLDKDGYVSVNDFKKTLSSMNILDDVEIDKLVEKVDSGNKGYLNFKEFSSHIRRSVNNLNQKGKPVVRNIMQPSNKHHKKRIADMPKMRQTVSAVTRKFRPDHNFKLKSKTRYGANPAHKNTFVNFQPSSKSPMYMTEEDRLTKPDQGLRTSYQRHDFGKKRQYSEARLGKIRSNSQQISRRIVKLDDKLDSIKKNRLIIKGAKNMIYEDKCVEYYDSIKDPIKTYFMEKIQITVSNTKALDMLIELNEQEKEQKTKDAVENGVTVTKTFVKKDTMEFIEEKLEEKRKEREAERDRRLSFNTKKKKRAQMTNLKFKVREENKTVRVPKIIKSHFDSTTNNDELINNNLSQQEKSIKERLERRRQLSFQRLRDETQKEENVDQGQKEGGFYSASPPKHKKITHSQSMSEIQVTSNFLSPINSKTKNKDGEKNFELEFKIQEFVEDGEEGTEVRIAEDEKKSSSLSSIEENEEEKHEADVEHFDGTEKLDQIESRQRSESKTEELLAQFSDDELLIEGQTEEPNESNIIPEEEGEDENPINEGQEE